MDASPYLVGVHRQACTSPDCTGCFPDVQHRPLRIAKPSPGGKGESEDRRRTRRNNDYLDRGVHPATLVGVMVGCSETCGTCAHHHVYSAGNIPRVHKCDLHRLGQSHSAASDVRVSWPACAYFDRPSEAD